MSVLYQVLFILHGRGTQGIRSPAPGEPVCLYALSYWTLDIGCEYMAIITDVKKETDPEQRRL